MIELRTLGATEVRPVGSPDKGVYLQPKRLAVLAYLTAARPAFQRALKAKRRDARALQDYALFLVGQCRFEETSAAVREWLDFDPAVAGPHFALGYLQRKTRRFEESTEQLEFVIGHIERCASEGSMHNWIVAPEPLFDPMRSEPRFREVLRRLHLPEWMRPSSEPAQQMGQ